MSLPNAPKLSSAMGNLLKRYAGTHYHYDTYGNLTRRIEPNGQTWHYQYDTEHRMVEASRYAQAPAAGDDAIALTHVRYAYDSLSFLNTSSINYTTKCIRNRSVIICNLCWRMITLHC
ncbi:hypothetical protein FBG13_01845 [Cobetia marina]|nr:hypothetical protein FBG13_01845 [Cobetia marina]GED44104.1 hypothetical protein HHA02_34330 [Cobetia marina]